MMVLRMTRPTRSPHYVRPERATRPIDTESPSRRSLLAVNHRGCRREPAIDRGTVGTNVA